MSGNALQTEFTALRDAGMRPRDTIASMIDWRRRAVLSLSGTGFVPPFVTELVSELTAEIERLRMTRRVAGVRP